MSLRWACHFKICRQCHNFHWIKKHWDGRVIKDMQRPFLCQPCHKKNEIKVEVVEVIEVHSEYEPSNYSSYRLSSIKRSDETVTEITEEGSQGV